MKFHDLGLLIIDEEQKFGVSVKEKLRQLKVNVDTLTMTATPIPRTLQFSLMGARDLSSITTPPPNRYPVQTEVERFNPDIIREAINFEMSRNGQVFFINKIEQDADRLFVEAMRRLHTTCTDPLQVLAWHEVYVHLELCTDDCEHVADVVDNIVMENS